MKNPRKENRLHLRFNDGDVIDDLEIHAGKLGLKLPEWARSTLIKALFIQKLYELLFRRAIESVFTTQKMLEQLCTPEQVEKAKTQARNHMIELEKHVRSE